MVKVEVTEGWLEGEMLKAIPGDNFYYSFKGIPYAEPPLGSLRFKAPRPPKPWSGIRKATQHGMNCPQIDIFTENLNAGSEDCLYLNVYTPSLTPESLLGVMFFIHGGGYKSGSGDIAHYGPDFLVQQNVVLVTINYRLEALGFLCMDTEEVPGNAGLKDQVEALKWVNKNIDKFGGNPKNITIFGESAGGASTMFHVLSPMTKGLFQRAISMSGVPIAEWSLPYNPRKRAFTLGKILGLETEDPKELLEFLQNIPHEKLIQTNPTIMASEEIFSDIIFKFYHFTPVIEQDFGGEHFLTEEPLNILKKGKINEVDIMIGHTNEEMVLLIPRFENNFIKTYNRYPELLVPRDISLNATCDKVLEASNTLRKHYFGNKTISVENMREFMNYVNDSTLIQSIVRYINHVPKKCGSKRYFYQFSAYSERNFYGKIGEKYGIKGASHLDDLLYLFDAKSLNLDLEENTREYKLIQFVCTVFANFAKYGNPTPDDSLGLIWPEYDNKIQAIVDIRDGLTIRKGHTEMANFWESIYKQAGIEY